MKTFNLAILSGDGIGPEIMAELKLFRVSKPNWPRRFSSRSVGWRRKYT